MRPIDADALLEAIRTDVMGGLNYRSFIEKAPTIEPKQGERIRHYAGYKCSLCHYGVQLWNTTNFCPNCGARMKGAYDVYRSTKGSSSVFREII